MEREGHAFHTSTDSEVIGKYLLATPGSWGDRFARMMRTFSGAYSLVILTPDRLMAARDPRGVRPLCLGRIDGGYVVASESCALDHIGATFVRSIAAGELVTITAEGVKSEQVASNAPSAGCVFEHIYFARPDSKLDGTLVYASRLAMGEELAREEPADADLVIGVPDSATAAAVGYARGSGLPYAEGLVKNRYVGRTFIQPDQRLRELGVNLKFNPLREVIEGKRLAVVDDSIVRGTTTPRIVQMLRAAGAARCICASARRPSATPASSASTWPTAANSSPRSARSPKSRSTSAPTAWATSASPGWSAPSAWASGTASPASPATTPCRCSSRWTSWPSSAPA